MKFSIVYATKYGATRLVAEAIARGCGDAGIEPQEIEVIDVRTASAVPDSDTIVIGSPVYGGRIPAAITRFMESHLDALVERRIGLYLCCLYDGARAEQQLADNFPARLVAHSFGQYFVGGRVDYPRMRWLDRFIMKRVAGIDHDVDTTKESEIRRLIEDLIGR